jgi:hypothetical protein
MMTKSQEIFRNKAKIEQYAKECGIENIFLHKPILEEDWTEKDSVHWMISTNLKFDSLEEDKRGSKLRHFNSLLRDLLTFPSEVSPQDLMQPLVNSISDLGDRQASQARIDAAIPLQELTEASLLEQFNQRLTSVLGSKESPTLEDISSTPPLPKVADHKTLSIVGDQKKRKRISEETNTNLSPTSCVAALYSPKNNKAVHNGSHPLDEAEKESSSSLSTRMNGAL